MTSHLDEYLVKKKRIFDALDKLDESTDDELDIGRLASEDALKRATAREQQKNGHAATKPERNALARSASGNNPRLVANDTANDTSAFPSITNVFQAPGRSTGAPASTEPNSSVIPPKPLLPRSLRQTVSDIASSSSSKPGSSKITGKRKRETPIKLVPEAHRIFRDLHFYFFPNNDSAPARRMRISKAREYGATWHQEWDSSVTHIVADRTMTFDQVKIWLKMETLPGHIIVVNETYPAECITYGALIDPSPVRFTVKGFVPAAVPTVFSMESDKSLQLKPARGKAQMERPIQTPPRESAIDVDATTTVIEPEPDAEDRYLQDLPRNDKILPSAIRDSSGELEAAIAKARALQAMHIGEDEDDDRPSSSEGLDSDGHVKKPGLQLLATRKGKLQQAQDKWQCMQKNTADKSRNPNITTIDILQQMADYYGQTGDEWRVRAYRKAISTLRNHPVKVMTKEEAGALPNIGSRLAEKIEEIAFTNRLRRLENVKADPQDQILQTFMGIYGAGIKQASEWVKQGYQSLDELLAKATLTPNQRIGIEHYTDFSSRIPRAEVAQHASIVRAALHALDPTFELIIGGSYRRGSPDSGDIDCIITRPATALPHLRTVVFNQLIPHLTATGFLVANLASSSPSTSDSSGSKFHGASQLPCSVSSSSFSHQTQPLPPNPHPWRRLDLLLVPAAELGAALIYFTGNDLFNRSLRLLAATKGLRLNQKGLYRDVLRRGRGPKGAQSAEGTLVEGRDERRIFALLGVVYRAPEERVC